MLVLCLLGVGSIFAQSTIKGDMNGDGKLTVADVTELVATINGKKGIEYLSLSDPYATDNTMLVGTWYLTKTSSITFNIRFAIMVFNAVCQPILYEGIH